MFLGSTVFSYPLDVTVCRVVNSNTDSGMDRQGKCLNQATFKIITSESNLGKNRVCAFKSRWKQKQHIDTARHPAMQAKESASGVCVKPVGPLFMTSSQAQHIPNHQPMNDTIYKRSQELQFKWRCANGVWAVLLDCYIIYVCPLLKSRSH